MEKGAFIGLVLGFVLAWWKGKLSPVGEGAKWESEPQTSEYYWRV